MEPTNALRSSTLKSTTNVSIVGFKIKANLIRTNFCNPTSGMEILSSGGVAVTFWNFIFQNVTGMTPV